MAEKRILPKGIEIIKTIDGGFSGAELYKVRKNSVMYFMKIYNYVFSDDEIKRLEEICKIYKEHRIKSLSVAEHGKLENEDKYYILYNYIEGIDVETHSEENLSLDETYEMGVNLGKQLRILQSYDLPSDTSIENENIEELVNLINDLYKNIKSNEEKIKLIKEYFTIEKMDERVEKLNLYKDMFESLKRTIIHGDIKRSNVMLDNDLDTHIIDIRNMKNSYDILNFRYQITWTLFEDNKKAKEFARGYFDGIYENARPDNFKEQIDFVVILNFIEETDKINEKEELEKYFDKIKYLFEIMDNTNEHIV